jgi:hypothetical protein
MMIVSSSARGKPRAPCLPAALRVGVQLSRQRHHTTLFPQLTKVHRTTFLRQAANPWLAKLELWQQLIGVSGRDEDLSILTANYETAPRPRHTMAVLLCQQRGLGSLSFNQFVRA